MAIRRAVSRRSKVEKSQPVTNSFSLKRLIFRGYNFITAKVDKHTFIFVAPVKWCTQRKVNALAFHSKISFLTR